MKGSSVKLALAYEGSYGASPGAFSYVPFISSGLRGEQTLLDNDILGLGRDAQRPARDVVNINGSVTVPIDAVNVGYWLKLLLGNPTTTGTGPYQHSFVSGSDTLPSAQLEFGDAGLYHLYKGVVANSFQLRAEPTGRVNAVFELLGASVTYATSSVAGSPTSGTLTRFNAFDGAIKKDGVALAKIVAADLRLSNNIELMRYIGGAGAVEDVVPGIFQATGTIEARISDNTLLTLANAGTLFDLDLTFTSGTNVLNLSYQSAEIASAGVPFEGPGAVQATFNLVGAKSGSNPSIKIDLTNSKSSY
jgi:hypothetical protein